MLTNEVPFESGPWLADKGISGHVALAPDSNDIQWEGMGVSPRPRFDGIFLSRASFKHLKIQRRCRFLRLFVDLY